MVPVDSQREQRDKVADTSVFLTYKIEPTLLLLRSQIGVKEMIEDQTLINSQD